MKKVFLVVLLSYFSLINAYAQDLASAIVGEDVSGQKYEEQKSEKQIADDRGIFSFLNFSFIKKPLSIFSSDKEKEAETESSEVVDETGQKVIETPLQKAERLANEGNTDMALSLGYMYLYGQDGVESNYQKAFYFYELAAKNNNPVALNNLGSLYFNGIGTEVNYNKAAELFLRAAQNGSDDAAVNLGFIYLTSGKKEYFGPAIELFEQAANSGNNTSKFMLGYAYYRGFVVDRDFHTAINLIRDAANANFDEAQFILAQMYENGEGIAKNYGNMVKYYRAAIAQGHVESMMNLAAILAEGRIYPKNIMQAHILYNIASVYGAKDAAEKRDSLERMLKIEELLEAQTAAENYRPGPSELTTYIRQTFGTNIRQYIDENLKKRGK